LSRAVSAMPLSGSSNVWKWASNIIRHPRFTVAHPQSMGGVVMVA
jgi:hypothetical protein